MEPIFGVEHLHQLHPPLSLWFTSSCTYHLITVPVFTHTIYHSSGFHSRQILSSIVFLVQFEGDSDWSDWSLAIVCFNLFFYLFIFGYMCLIKLTTPSAFQSTLNSLLPIVCSIVTARLRQCCAGGLTSLPLQPSAVSAQRCCAIYRRPTTLRPHHRLHASFHWSRSLSWRQSSIVHWTVRLLATWLQIYAVCLTCRPDDVWDRHSLTSSMSVSRSVLLLETELSLWLVCSTMEQSATWHRREWHTVTFPSWTRNMFI